jgi:hypothetical protein
MLFLRETSVSSSRPGPIAWKLRTSVSLRLTRLGLDRDLGALASHKLFEVGCTHRVGREPGGEGELPDGRLFGDVATDAELHSEPAVNERAQGWRKGNGWTDEFEVCTQPRRGVDRRAGCRRANRLRVAQGRVGEIRRDDLALKAVKDRACLQ